MIRWVLASLVVANLGMMAVNGANMARMRRTANLQDEATAALKQAFARLPPHPCTDTAWPGEDCTKTFMLRIPPRRAEPSW